MTVEIGPVGGLSSPVGLDLEQLTRLITLLGRARSRMLEGTPKQSLHGKAVETVIDPPWYIKSADIDGSLLAFDHPFFGPVAFVIPRDDVAKIVQGLSSHLECPAVQQGKPN
ncbi:hypothetical protein AA309_24570 [Microvirga vignae]|uniref:Uncharacterized protein n=1 Tax=Microvirga vignae TaxID=1225564 RepID=A0A0H1R5X1_9HYPH|nr:hypothetical protein AA309_24570 [Microvirga vignae]